MSLAKPTVEVKRRIVKELALQPGAAALVCRLLGLSESSYYYEGAGYVDAKADMQVLVALIKLAGKKPTYGYRRLTDELRRYKRFSDIKCGCAILPT